VAWVWIVGSLEDSLGGLIDSGGRDSIEKAVLSSKSIPDRHVFVLNNHLDHAIDVTNTFLRRLFFIMFTLQYNDIPDSQCWTITTRGPQENLRKTPTTIIGGDVEITTMRGRQVAEGNHVWLETGPARTSSVCDLALKLTVSSVSQTILTVSRNRSWAKKPVPQTAASQDLTHAEHSKKPFGKWPTCISILSTDGEAQRRFRIRDEKQDDKLAHKGQVSDQPFKHFSKNVTTFA
jgi:hypothetical protein